MYMYLIQLIAILEASVSLTIMWIIFLSMEMIMITSFTLDISIFPFHKDFSPSGKQLEDHKLAHEL